MEAFVVHVSLAGSNASTVAFASSVPILGLQPPTAYSTPFTTPLARRDRLVGMGAFVVQASPELADDASWCAGAADGARCAGLVESRQATARSNTRRLGSAARLVCLPINLSFP